MRVSGSLMLRGFVSGVALVGACTATHAIAEDRAGVANLMISTNDLEPLARAAAMQRASVDIPQLGRVPLAIDGGDRNLRSSVPPVNRSMWMVRDDEVFAYSSLAFPLLVDDLDTPATAVSRPLVGGRLVGVRPSLPINRKPMTRSLLQQSSR
ncbi:MAG: hypothetical protein ACKO40_16115 [Planctomycetaceae bacterium]